MSTLVIEPEGSVVCRAISIARTRRERVRGLIGRPPLAGSEALLLEKSPQVHTFGMTYPLDVIFCDRDLRVLHVSRAIAPRRVSRWVRGTRYAIEMRAGSVPRSVTPGVQLGLR